MLMTVYQRHFRQFLKTSKINIRLLASQKFIRLVLQCEQSRNLQVMHLFATTFMIDLIISIKVPKPRLPSVLSSYSLEFCFCWAFKLLGAARVTDSLEHGDLESYEQYAARLNPQKRVHAFETVSEEEA